MFTELIDIINGAIVVCGLPTLTIAAIKIGRKLEILDGLQRSMGVLEPEVRDINIRLSIIEHSRA